MQTQSPTIQKLLEKYKEIALLGKMGALLGWDLEVNLPINASQSRAEQSAYITKLITEKWLDVEFRTLLEEGNKELKKLGEEEQSIVRNLNRGANFYYKVPKDLVIKLSEETSKAFMSWAKARQSDDFKAFVPNLKSLLDISKTIADKVGYKDNPYDALLDLYESDLTAKMCTEIFSNLTPKLTEILEKIKGSDVYKKQQSLSVSDKTFPQNKQEEISLFVLRKMGYDFNAGRLNVAPHPFTSELDANDVRITTRYKVNDFIESIMVAMHEGGHALYEQGVSKEYADTPLGGGVSLGIHESQSRFWENQIGRSRAFFDYLSPVLRSYYHSELGTLSDDEVFSLFNKVRPGLIRVEADEVTYNLHIALRFEIEKALINDEIKVEDLPEVWNEKMKEYLGVVPESNANGVLQDVHWSHASFGYFPTYTLGNLYGAQITRIMNQELSIKDLSEKGNLDQILSWLRDNVHKFGSLYTPGDLIEKISGEKLNPRYFVDYIKEKYGEIYEIRL